MAPGMSYDDSGSLANYFGVTFLALILVPTTYFAFKPERRGTSYQIVLSRMLADIQNNYSLYVSAPNVKHTPKSYLSVKPRNKLDGQRNAPSQSY